MQFSDPRKLKVVETMLDMFDFEEFKTKCEALNLSLYGSEIEYAQKLGMLLYAKHKYPSMSSLEAYMSLVSGDSVQTLTGNCMGCGGGEVR